MIQQDKEVLSPLNKRTKGKHLSDYRLQDAYKFFVKKYGKLVDYNTYRRICETFNDEQIMHNTILKGLDFYLPVILGTLGVRKKLNKPYFDTEGNLIIKHIPVDYKATRILWAKDPVAKAEKKLIRNLNEHTSRYRYRFYWDKRTCTVVNQSAYVFLPTRTHSRELAAILNNPTSEVDFCLETKC